MNSKEIRSSFIEYFRKRDHKIVRSAPTVPIDDSTLLFTNAGMNQFKPIFLDEVEKKFSRAVNSQKCIRVSGKHNDLEEVGVDAFHHTFFEMLGNWSFGDYYKEEAIEWAWNLLTKEWELDKRRLWATVYEDDDEAFELWKKITDIEPSRVIKCGKQDNFWEMGDTGPCGPCSEIHYFVGDDLTNQDPNGVNNSSDYWELWNLVFIQSNRLSDGEFADLSNKHIDTGAGLERIASVLQGKKSNYDTDLFIPIIESVKDIAESSYEESPIPHRVIADHIRMLCFSIADGALPSNDGRGYVLRRILRRAARYGRSLNLDQPFLHALIPSVTSIMGGIYPELLDKENHIKKVIEAEEVSFNKTLDRGLNHFEKLVSRRHSNGISGTDAFKLYDTYGFPLDLTQVMAKERGLDVDISGFDEAMLKQKTQAKASGQFIRKESDYKWTVISEGKDSYFVGYESVTCESKVRRFAIANDQILVVLDKTPFYAESGGQVGDVGSIKGNHSDLKVIDVKKENDIFIHICSGKIDKDVRDVECFVDEKRRDSTKKNHTATHLMHRALKNVLGDHVNQAGSLVHPDYLRFDLTHFKKITSEEIVEVEKLVNEQILLNTKLSVSVQNFDDAKKAGAEALFGEKYGDRVRVVEVGAFSMELCGGTHVNRTGDIGSFIIKDEASLSSGVRRVVALTGYKAVSETQKNYDIVNSLQQILNVSSKEVVTRVSGLLDDKKVLEKKLKNQLSANASVDLFKNIGKVGEHSLLISKIETPSMQSLKAHGDSVYNKLSSGIAVLLSRISGKPAAVVVISKNLNQKGIQAGVLAKDIGSMLGGGGGGRPHLATAGGSEETKIDDVIPEINQLLTNILEN